MNRAYQPSFMHKVEKLETINPEGASYRFNEWNNKSQKHFAQHGFVVIKSILTEPETIYAKSLLWNFLSGLGWKRNDPSTWNTHYINRKGIIWGHGAGQSQLQWFLRSRTKIVETFANVWSSQDIYSKQGIVFDYKRDIITSMDGFSVFRPWYLNINGALEWKTQSGWYHIDQNIARNPSLETIQGIVSLYDQDKSTGSTVFVPGSHLWVQKLVPNLSVYKGDFVMISKKKMDKLNKKKILLCCKAGDLVLWDSRCIHCNSPALLSEQEMRKTHNHMHNQKRNANNLNMKDTQHKENDEDKKEEIHINTSHNKSKSEHRFIQSMNDNYLKPKIRKIRKNLDGITNRIEYNGYIAEVVLWDTFDPKLFTDGKAYLFCLPWNTSLLWIPQWMDKITAEHLKKTILDKVKFEEPILRFDVKNKNGEIIGVKQVKQNRSTAWICNDFDKYIQNREDTAVLPAIALDEWSECLLKHASNTASHDFNAMLTIHYKNGRNAVNLHSDDIGLGVHAIIGSLSLGSKRTFFIKSKQIYDEYGEKIEFRIPLTHGSFVMMNAGFQEHWLHSIPKEKHVRGDRVNVTFRKYMVQTDKSKNMNVDVDSVDVPSVLRAVSYICMVPKLKVKSKDVIRQRIAAYETHSTCSHWPQHCQILYKPENMKEQSISDVNDDLIKSLIGIDILSDQKYNNLKDFGANNIKSHKGNKTKKYRKFRKK